jgi:predicted nucleic acid-binding protein
MNDVLVDTSIWINHLKTSNKKLISLLEDNFILTHEFIIGELACGSIKKRKEFLKHLKRLPLVKPATHEECLYFLEKNNLTGSGIGWIDIHLLSSCKLTGCKIWTNDTKLKKVAKNLKLNFQK